MADTLEIRLGGQFSGRYITPRDLDFTEIDPLVKHLVRATIIESGLESGPDVPRPSRGRRPKTRPPELSKVHLALEAVSSPKEASSSGACYLFTVGPEVSEAVSKITAGLARQSDSRILPEAATQVRLGLSRTIGRGLSVQLVNGVTTPIFSASNPPPELDVYLTRNFESEIAVRVIRVGGKNPVVRVRLLGSGKEATLKLSGPAAARELGHHLYRDAILKGKGEWVIDPDRFFAPTQLVSFMVSGYRFLQQVHVDKVIDEMTRATDGIWDGVDPTDPRSVEGVPEESGDLP